MNKTGVPLTGNPIQQNPALIGMKVKLNAFVMFDVADEIAQPGDIVILTGLQSFLYAGAGYAYQVQKGEFVFWVKSQSITRLEE